MIRMATIFGGGLAMTALALALALPVRSAPALDGAQLFADNCSACHQADGKGIPGAFPALAGDPFVVSDPAKVAETLINGRGGMPSFKDTLNDAQLAAILAHVRSSWGNAAPPIAPEQFAAARTGRPSATH